MSLFAATLEPQSPMVLGGIAGAGLLVLVGLRRSLAPEGILGAIRSGLRCVALLVVVYAVVSVALLALKSFIPELAVSIRPMWPWPLLLVMGITTLGVVLGTYPQRLMACPTWQRMILLSMRLIAGVLLLLAMLRPELQWSKKNDSAGLFPVLLDFSRSMSVKDGPANMPRFDVQLKALEDNRSLLKQLGQKLQVQEFQYSKGLAPRDIGTGATAPALPNPLTGDGANTGNATKPTTTETNGVADDKKLPGHPRTGVVDNPGSQVKPYTQTAEPSIPVGNTPHGDQTAIGFALDELLKNSPNQRIAGVLLMGDFAQRALSPFDIDPRLIAQSYFEKHIPIYTVPFGAGSLTNAGRDLMAEDLVVSPTVFVKNTVIVGAKVRALGAMGREQTVQLLVETPSNRLPGQPPLMEVRKSLKIKPRGNEDILPVELDFIPQQAGEFRVTLKVLPDEGETILTNNELTTFITVLKGGLSIAYFDVARNEVVPIQNMAKSPDIQLDFKLVRFGQRFGEFVLEEDWFQPGKYDVYILGDVPAQLFVQPKFKKSPLMSIHESVERGAGLLMLGGVRNYGPGGYSDTPLAVTLPILIDPAERQVGLTLDPSLNLLGPQPMLPTPEGLSHFIMRIETQAKNEAKWKELPPLNGASKLGRLKPLAQVLARNPEGKPLMVSMDYGRGRSIAFAGDTTYRWALAGHEDASQRFWRQMILWLAHKELQGDSTVWLKLNDRRFRPNQPVEMTFGAKDAEGVPVPDVQFKVSVYNPKGEQKTLAGQVLGQDHIARFADTLGAGEYTAEVEATKGGMVLGVTRARFIVYEHDLELNNPASDAAFAAELAQITSGQMVPPEELPAFLRALLKKDLQLDETKLTTVRLWDNWIFLVIFVSIMTIEWFVRKSRGMV